MQQVIKLESVLITFEDFKDFADQIVHRAIRPTQVPLSSHFNIHQSQIQLP